MFPENLFITGLPKNFIQTPKFYIILPNNKKENPLYKVIKIMTDL